MSFKLKVITPYGVFYEGDIDSLNVCTKQGYLTILPNHIPLVAPLAIDSMSYKANKETRVCVLAGGIMYVSSDETKIIANACEYKEDIDINRALEAKKRAEQRLEHKTTNINVTRAEAALKRALNRIETFNK